MQLLGVQMTQMRGRLKLSFGHGGHGPALRTLTLLYPLENEATRHVTFQLSPGMMTHKKFLVYTHHLPFLFDLRKGAALPLAHHFWLP